MDDTAVFKWGLGLLGGFAVATYAHFLTSYSQLMKKINNIDNKVDQSTLNNLMKDIPTMADIEDIKVGLNAKMPKELCKAKHAGLTDQFAHINSHIADVLKELKDIRKDLNDIYRSK